MSKLMECLRVVILFPGMVVVFILALLLIAFVRIDESGEEEVEE
jgi:hypothetical protein